MEKIDYLKFVNSNKSLIIAPAGYGKTHAIAESLNHTTGVHLILTHTHAGINSIKEKIKKLKISNKKYNIETICGFANKYVTNFINNKNEIPDENSRNDLNNFLVKKACELFDLKFIKNILQENYKGLFVDEYQDCTKSQHAMIIKLSEILPVHILGDPMQAIMPEGENLINFDRDLQDFNANKQILNIPHRWKDSSPKLGKKLAQIRHQLEENEPILLSNYKQIENNDTCYKGGYQKNLFQEIQKYDNLLIINPSSYNKNARIKFVKSFKMVKPMFSIDDDFYYELSNICDQADMPLEEKVKILYDKLFDKKSYNKIFGAKGIKNNISGINLKNIILEKKEICLILEEIFNKRIGNCYIKEVFRSLIKAIQYSKENHISVYDSMMNTRNSVKRLGGERNGKYIGTTLLTKGLEFDNVIILDAEKFKCKKNFYVAITRARKKLIIFSKDGNLQLN